MIVTFTRAEIEEWIALHRQKVVWLTAAKKDASYHERRIRELTKRLESYAKEN